MKIVTITISREGGYGEYVQWYDEQGNLHLDLLETFKDIKGSEEALKDFYLARREVNVNYERDMVTENTL